MDLKLLGLLQYYQTATRWQHSLAKRRQSLRMKIFALPKVT